MMQRSILVFLLFFFVSFPLLGKEQGADKQQWQNPKDNMIFIRIPAGNLLAEIPSDTTGEVKPKEEKISFPDGFWMGKTEVTVKQFRNFIKQTKYVTEAEKANNKFTWKSPGFKQQDNHPVVYLNYKDALAYTLWAGVELPTQAEWLYACRADTTTRYYWGNTVDDRFVWHRANSIYGTRPVATKLPNPWGLYDMVGSAWEYAKVCENNYTTLGSSWTRCPSYKTRQGFMAENMLAETLSPRLKKCEPNNDYPWDDDRGFRCVKRINR